MIIENRFIEIDELKKEKFDKNILVGIGSEGCVHAFCVSMDNYINYKNVENINFKFRIITPRIPNKYLDIVLKKIKQIVEKLEVESIVINDYGLLYNLYNSNIKKVDFILGRTLIRSLEYVPWAEYFLENEKKELKKNATTINMLHNSKLKLFKQFNIKGIEVCLTNGIYKDILMLKELGLKIYMHFNTIIGSIGRTCPLVRIFNDIEVGNCTSLCKSTLNIELSKMKSKNIMFYKKEELNIMPKCKAIGNVIYYYSNIKDFPYKICDCVIFDNRLNHYSDMKNII